MKTLFKISLLFTALFLNSCTFMSGIEGNKNVVSENRSLDGDFTSIKVSQGIDVFLSQESDVKLKVEMDENLHELLLTEIVGDELQISFKENVGRRKASNVYLSMPEIKAIRTSSGADVQAHEMIEADEIKLKASSGSQIEILINATRISCYSSSGSDIELSGSCDDLIAESSSGSKIEAESLKAKTVKVNASSGSNIDVYASESIVAKASSGADVDCIGNPNNKDISKSSGGSVSIR